MAGMSGGSMLRARRKDVNIKPNRRLDRKSSRGMIYENEELRLRTININAEVERGQTDIKKLKRENEQLRREVGALRGEYDRLERLLHQRQDKESPERQDDEKASFSCCSDCESDCCDVQNDANAAWDYPGPMSASTPAHHGAGGPCCGGMGGEPLSSVPEEPNSPRGPPENVQVIPACRCQPTPSEFKPSNCGFSATDPPREFFTAVVTVPLSSHLPSTPPAISMPPATVFPKTGLDILINNNTFENFESFTLPPPIGFVVPPPPLHEPSDEEPFQIVPDVELTNTPEVSSSYTPELMFHIPGPTSQQPGFIPLCQELTTHFNESPVFSENVVMCGGLYQNEDNIPSENFDCSSGTLSCSNTVIPFGQDSICGFQNGGNIEDLLGDLDSVSSSSDFAKDSIFVCKTRKVIQQLTTVQNSNVGASCGCNCRCNVNQTDLAKAPDVVIIDSNSDGSQFFRTEKNIELNYDYPKTVTNNGVCERSLELPGEILGSQDVFGRNVDLTQTTHTTTEVNSTVMMFRKKNPLKSKSKFPLFGRSHSAPVDTVSDEPIYATVRKLPKKLKRLNIRNLENEIRYVPPEEHKAEERKEEEVKVEAVVQEPILPKVKEEVIDVAPKANGVAHKSSMKADSLSESSEKGNLNLSTNNIPKTPLVRKKKRFSIHFKRKTSKNSKTSIKEETAEQTKPEAPVVKNTSDLLEIDVKSSESDKLIEASSSPDSPDTVKFKQHPPVFCKKHGKPKHCRESHTHHPHHSNHAHLSHCGSPKPHRRDEGYPHHGCLLHKSGSDRSTELAMKTGFHPSKSYFKQDSYQEMTTSHSERERTNSLSSSGHSGFSLGSKPRSMSTSRREDNIPWCGCWGNSCL